MNLGCLKQEASISVIIPTKNRAKDLAITIQTLLSQSHPPSELIIVDQSQEKSFAKSLPISVHYIHNDQLSGVNEARNVAMEIASGEIWLFLDDDVELEPSFIEELLRAYAPGVIGVSGIITNYSKPNIFQHMWESLFLRGVFHDDRQSLYRNAERLVNSPPVKVRQFGGGLMSFRASAIRNLRWDANLTGACPGDDVDFCARLPKGSALIISTNARLVHKRSPSPAGGDSDHWLLLHAQVANYMRQRHWRKGLWNNLCFAWLNVGYAIAGAAACLNRRSMEPWRKWLIGASKGKQLGTKQP